MQPVKSVLFTFLVHVQNLKYFSGEKKYQENKDYKFFLEFKMWFGGSILVFIALFMAQILMTNAQYSLQGI